MISVSRNTPIVLIVGAAGFLGSYLCDRLLGRGIQVIGVDNLSTGRKDHLSLAAKSKNFHFLNCSIEECEDLGLPRLDYALFAITDHLPRPAYRQAWESFLKICRGFGPKVMLLSSIKLYDPEDIEVGNLQEAEKVLAQKAKEGQINGRIIRLSAVFGPRMHFREHDPIVKLIQASIKGELQKEMVFLDFTSRSLFVDDAADLILKSIFAGSTVHKIFDGALMDPVKMVEIKQVLLDPIWHENRGFVPTQLPPWPTPNLERTMRELHWRPSTNLVAALKQTLAYFRENPALFKAEEGMKIQRGMALEEEREVAEKKVREKIKEPLLVEEGGKFKEGIKRGIGYWWFLLGVGVLGYGLIFPLISLTLSFRRVPLLVQEVKVAWSAGELEKVQTRIDQAQGEMGEWERIFSFLGPIKKGGFWVDYINSWQNLSQQFSTVFLATEHSTLGLRALYDSLEIVLTSKEGDLAATILKAQSELDSGHRLISQLKAQLDGGALDQNEWGKSYQEYVEELYRQVSQIRQLAILLPDLVAVDGQKSYLIILQDNTELRPTGGLISSLIRLDFDKGKLVKVTAEEVDTLDKELKEKVLPPPEIRSDLGRDRWSLGDANFDPDFPTSARRVGWFYQQETGKKVAGVVGMDLATVSSLLKMLGSVEMGDEMGTLDGENLVEKVVTYSRKQNFMTTLHREVLNRLFFGSPKNWSKITTWLIQAAKEKHLLVYLSDPTLFRYVASLEWAGIVPKQEGDQGGEKNDFMMISEANMGGNKTNLNLQRSLDFQVSMDQEGRLSRKLAVTYLNRSATAGDKYRHRLRVYLPSGSKLVKVLWGGKDITDQVSSLSDYGRAVYSMLLELGPKEQKSLAIEYQDTKLTAFLDNQLKYRLMVVKQPGWGSDKIDLTLTYGSKMRVKSASLGKIEKDKVFYSTTLSEDLRWEVLLKK